MDEEFEVVIIGAGPAGIAAAIRLAQAGFEEIMVLERGEYPGSKNVYGGILFTHQLLKLLPDTWEEAPLERSVTRRRFGMLSEDSEIALDVKVAPWRDKPYNHTVTALRGRFDQWFAGQAEALGVNVIPEMMVSELLIEDDRVVGVKTEPGGDEIRAKIVISAEGVHAFLARQAGLMAPVLPQTHMIANVKEVFSLPKEKIEDRFMLEGKEGVAMEYFGDVVKGRFGMGFVYTNEDTVSIGLGLTIKELIASKQTLNDFLEGFKKHPTIRKMLEGAESVEYLAHMIPDYGYNHLPHFAMPGLMLVGDTAGLINASLYHEGTNLAMGSGILAAETLIEAKEHGHELNTMEAVAHYRDKMENSFILKDMFKFRKMPDFFNKFPHYLKQYPTFVSEVIQDYFTIDETPKQDVEDAILKRVKEEIGYWRMAVDMFKAGRVLR